MSYNKGLIAEINMESANTRKILSMVPTEKNDWKPHEKSMKMGNLANHIAELNSWIPMILTTGELDLATMNYKPEIPASSEQLTGKHDDQTSKAIAALENADDAEFDKMWTLRRGDHVMFTMPKKAVIRAFALSHLYHHRGQLSVYLRLLDVPIPGMYGPSADDVAAMTKQPAPAEMTSN